MQGKRYFIFNINVIKNFFENLSSIEIKLILLELIFNIFSLLQHIV